MSLAQLSYRLATNPKFEEVVRHIIEKHCSEGLTFLTDDDLRGLSLFLSETKNIQKLLLWDDILIGNPWAT